MSQTKIKFRAILKDDQGRAVLVEVDSLATLKKSKGKVERLLVRGYELALADEAKREKDEENKTKKQKKSD